MFELIGLIHWDVLIKIIMVDLLLGIDNAIIIAMAVSALALEQRNKAIFLGTAGAILARIAFLFIGFLLIGLPFVKLAAGGYLIYLAYSMMTSVEDEPNVKKSASLWGAASTIVIADLLLSLDNVLALVGASESAGDHAFGYTVFGILFSIPVIILASKVLIKALDKFPIIMWVGAGLIAWIGMEMLLKEQFIHNLIGSGILHTGLMVGVTAATVGGAYLVNKTKQNKS